MHEPPSGQHPLKSHSSLNSPTRPLILLLKEQFFFPDSTSKIGNLYSIPKHCVDIQRPFTLINQHGSRHCPPVLAGAIVYLPRADIFVSATTSFVALQSSRALR